MDTDNDQDFGGVQPVQGATLPYTAPQNLQLQRLNQGLQTAQNLVDDGELFPEEGEKYQEMIEARRAPLMQAQQAAREQAKQAAQQQAMEQHSLVEAMEQEAAAYRALGFNGRVAVYTDPLTGKTAHMVEDGKGKWEPIDFDSDPSNPPEGAGPALAAQAGSGDQGGAAGPVVSTLGTQIAGQAVNFGGDGSGQSPWNDVTVDASPTVAGGGGGAASAQPAIQDVRPQPDGSHVMTIINGQNQERWRFDPDGTTTLIGQAGPRADAARQQQQIDQLVPPHKIAALSAQAVQMYPDKSRGQYPAGPHGDVAYARDQNQVLRNRASFVNEQARLLGQQAISQGTQQSIADRQKAAREAQAQTHAERQNVQALKSGYIKDRLDVEKHVMEGFKSGVYPGSGREVKDAQGNVTGHMPTNEEWEAQVGKVLDSLGMARDVNEHLARFGITLPGAQRQPVAPGAPSGAPPATEEDKQAEARRAFKDLLGNLAGGQAFKRHEPGQGGKLGEAGANAGADIGRVLSGQGPAKPATEEDKQAEARQEFKDSLGNLAGGQAFKRPE